VSASAARSSLGVQVCAAPPRSSGATFRRAVLASLNIRTARPHCPDAPAAMWWMPPGTSDHHAVPGRKPPGLIAPQPAASAARPSHGVAGTVASQSKITVRWYDVAMIAFLADPPSTTGSAPAPRRPRTCSGAGPRRDPRSARRCGHEGTRGGAVVREREEADVRRAAGRQSPHRSPSLCERTNRSISAEETLV